MSADPDIITLQTQLTQLERHVEAQDAECFKLNQKIEKLSLIVSQQAEKIKSLSDSDGFSPPADEKPPHY